MERDIKTRIDCVIDCMNTLRFLCELDTLSNPAKLFADSRNNDVLVYDNTYMWELCEKLDRMPEIEPITWATETENTYMVYMCYRGVKFHTYIKPSEKQFFEDKMAEYQQRLWDEMAEDKKDDEDEE